MTMPRLVVAALALLTLGCASGPIAGELTVPGEPPAPVVLRYRSSVFGGSGKLWTTLPPGEKFEGSYLLRPTARDGQMPGTLNGDKGGTMACQFQLNEPGIGPDKGGTVRCEVSTGGVFDARF